MPYNGFTIEELLEEFKKDMFQKFVDHDEKWGNNSAIRQSWDFDAAFVTEELRKEVSYHYSKWLYRGVFKKDLKEDDTLTNMANMCFLLWARIRAEREREEKMELVKILHDAMENKKRVVVEFMEDSARYACQGYVLKLTPSNMLIEEYEGEKKDTLSTFDLKYLVSARLVSTSKRH